MAGDYPTTTPDGNGAGHAHGGVPDARRDARTVPDDRASMPRGRAGRRASGAMGWTIRGGLSGPWARTTRPASAAGGSGHVVRAERLAWHRAMSRQSGLHVQPSCMAGAMMQMRTPCGRPLRHVRRVRRPCAGVPWMDCLPSSPMGGAGPRAEQGQDARAGEGEASTDLPRIRHPLPHAHTPAPSGIPSTASPAPAPRPSAPRRQGISPWHPHGRQRQAHGGCGRAGMDAASPCLQGMRPFGWCILSSASCIAGRCSQRTSLRTSTDLHLGTGHGCVCRSVWKALRRIAGRSPLCWPMP